MAVIFGGRSGEHDVSIRSARSVIEALKSSRYKVREFFIDKEGRWDPAPLSSEPGGNPGIDVVFPLVHGTFGEDGTLQGLLELAALPYVGAGVLASAVSMDKALTKSLCCAAGLPVVDFVVLNRDHFDSDTLQLPFGFPVFVKPANLGSSVGISKAKNHEQLAKALELACRYDHKIVVEQGINGREFECAVLGGSIARASVPCEIHPSQEFYTYEDKYVLDTARIDLPAQLTPEQTARIQHLAVACFDAVGCEGMARVDFLFDKTTGEFFVNEINTIPGFTSISMFPKMWEYSGVSYPALLDELINLALQRADKKKQSQYVR